MVIKRSHSGFTIVEAMIVLAISTSILLIVFLAIPALQRSSRNTQRRADASSLLTAVYAYTANNKGNLATTTNGVTVQFSGAAAYASVYPQLNFYKRATNVGWNYSSTARTSTPSAPSAIDNITIYNYLKCSGNAATRTGALLRNIIALYRVETRSGNTQQCLQG